MAAWLDVCRFNPTAGGTTDWTFSSAVNGYQSPSLSGVVNSRLYKYRAESADLTQWEMGEGAYNTGTGVLPRTTVLYNSSGTGTATGQSGAGTKINFSTVPQVAVVALKEDLISIEEANAFSATQQQQARANIAAAPFDALAFNGIQINGSLDFFQEFGTAQQTLATTVAKYAADQWQTTYTHAANTAVIKTQQVTPPGSPSFGLAFPNCLQITATTALSSPAAGDFAFVQQQIEGYRWSRLGFGNANAQSVTVGFWVYATISGTMAVVFRQVSGARSIPVDVAINNPTTWEFKTVTVVGDTAGSWTTDNTTSGTLLFGLCCGSTFQGANNAWVAANNLGTASTTNFFATANNTVCITGVIIVPGREVPIASRSPFIMRSVDLELPFAQRYLSKVGFDFKTVPTDGGASLEYAGTCYALNSARTMIRYPATMRAVPTATFFRGPNTATAAKWGVFDGTWVAATTALLNPTPDMTTIDLTGTTAVASHAVVVEGGMMLKAQM